MRFVSSLKVPIAKKGVILRVIEENRPDYVKDREQVYALEFKEPFSKEQLTAIVSVDQSSALADL